MKAIAWQALQMFGEISTGGKIFNAMMCRDVDRPWEIMLHWWNKADGAEAVRLKLHPLTPNRYKLELLNIYRAGQNGSLYLPDLTAEEKETFKLFSASVEFEDDIARFEWKRQDNQALEKFTLRSSKLDLEVTPVRCETWADFKNWASSAKKDHHAVMFRGHGSSKFRLCTTLARAGRTRLERYVNDTLDEFRQHCEAIFQQRFDTSNGHDFSTLLALAQHHGLPTPLLDFTSSPYIAAYFAFADALQLAHNDDPEALIRIYGLTEQFELVSTLANVGVAGCSPYVSPLAVSARYNPRLYVQQGKFVITNVADLEGFLCGAEGHVNQNFMVAVDIPASEAVTALQDLRYMGLTASSLFPGLDGVCTMLKQAMHFPTSSTPSPGLPVAPATTPSTQTEELAVTKPEPV